MRPKIAVAEYLGKFPGRDNHGKSSKMSRDYVRTKPEIMDEIKEKTDHQSCFRVWQNVEGKLDIGGPRDRKQVENAKYNEKKRREREEGEEGKKGNFADQVLILLNMVKTESDFVRCVKVTSKKVPTCILYTEDQVKDIKRFCCDWPLSHSLVSTRRSTWQKYI